MTRITLDHNIIIDTDFTIDLIDNNLRNIGYIKITDIHKKQYIITLKNIVFIQEI